MPHPCGASSVHSRRCCSDCTSLIWCGENPTIYAPSWRHAPTTNGIILLKCKAKIVEMHCTEAFNGNSLINISFSCKKKKEKSIGAGSTTGLSVTPQTFSREKESCDIAEQGNITSLKADKGRCKLILHTVDYHNKVLTLIKTMPPHMRD